MSGDPTIAALLRFSRECLESACDDIDAGRWQRAASSLYYSAYDAARAVFAARHIETRAHRHLRSEFHRRLVREGVLPKEDGQLYELLFELRLRADYDPDAPLAGEDVQSLVQRVEELLRKLNALAAPPAVP